MATCALFCKTLVFAFFAINAWNRFKSANQETEAFKRNLASLESSVKGRLYPNYANQASSLLNPHAGSIVYFGSLAQLLFSVLGVGCCWCASLAGLIYFLFQVVALNFAKINFMDIKDLERYALPTSLFVAALVLGSCGSGRCYSRKSCSFKKPEEQKSQEQSRTKRRD